jgi:hypothetical protein
MYESAFVQSEWCQKRLTKCSLFKSASVAVESFAWPELTFWLIILRVAILKTTFMWRQRVRDRVMVFKSSKQRHAPRCPNNLLRLLGWTWNTLSPWKRKLRFHFQTKSLRYPQLSTWAFAVNNVHFSHLVKVRKNSHSLSLQAFLTHSHSLSLSLAGLSWVLHMKSQSTEYSVCWLTAVGRMLNFTSGSPNNPDSEAKLKTMKIFNAWPFRQVLVWGCKLVWCLMH